MPAKKKSRKQVAREEQDARLADEARRAYDAEQERKAAEAAAQAILDEEQRAQRAKDQEEEQARLAAMRKEDKRVRIGRGNALELLDADMKSKDEWKRFTACVPLPDVAKESELNTYKSTWLADEEEQDPHLMLTPTVDTCAESEKVIYLLTEMVGEAREKWDIEKVKWYENYINEVRDKTFAKLDRITTAYLQRADDYENANNEGGEMEHVALMSYGKEDVRYGVFVHTASEPRAKAVDFSKDIEFHIALPSTLHRRRTAIRLIYTCFNHLHASAKLNVHNEPKTLYPWPNLLEQEREMKERESQDAKSNIQTVQYSAVGGIIYLEQLHLPLVPRNAGENSWLMREITDVSTKVMLNPYPEKGTQGDVALPFYVSYTIPKHVILREGEAPQYGTWDEASQSWNSDHASASEYNEQTREVTVQVAVTKPFSIIQPRTIDFPYRSWTMKPMSKTCVHLSVTGSRCQVKFEVTPGELKLLEPSYPVLVGAGLHNTAMRPGLLLARLSNCGLNLLPTDEDAYFARKPLKAPGLEPFLHEQLGSVCHVFEFEGSLFNSSRLHDQALVRLRLDPNFDSALLDIQSDEALLALAPEDAEVLAAREAAQREAQAAIEAEEARLAEEKKRKEEEDEEEDDLLSTLRADAGDKPVEEEPEEVVEEPVEEIKQLAKKFGEFNDWVNILSSTEKCCVVAINKRGPTSSEPVEDRITHTTLRRCVVEQYEAYSAPVNGEKEAHITYDLKEVLANLDRSSDTLQLQETVKRTLNLLRPFTFH